MIATQVLPETLSDDYYKENNVSEITGYLIVKERKHEVKRGETKIGRESSLCSITIEDFTVSKVHAVIESEGIDDTFIYDAGSTNQTKLGKKLLKPHCRYKLDNDSKLTFGNITAKFVLPPDKISNSTLDSKLNSEDFNQLDELGDIFDLATQVTTSNTSAKIPVFENQPETKVFKKPTVILPASVKESKNIFNEVTQCRLDSQQTSKKVIENFESSNIFNLNTQCQLYEPQDSQEQVDESEKTGEEDTIKSLLNDGQDDVLCVFMSLYSPKEQNSELLKEIKTEVEDLCEVFDAPTQIEPVFQKPAKLDSSNKENFCIITSTPLINRTKPSNREVVEKEEDFIETQQFNGDGEKKGNQSQDEETQLYLLDTIDDPSTVKNKDEDLILTQNFVADKSEQNAGTAVIPESEGIDDDEDFMATQLYDVEKEISAKVTNVPETLDVRNDLTERNMEDDFIETQIFDKNLERGVEEDFIATQPVNIPVNKPHIIEKSPTKSRESTPDLMGFENTWACTKDYISTHLFEVPERQTDSSCLKNCSDSHNPQAESSGDETESDLEILFDKTEAGESIKKSFKTEPESQPQNMEADQNDSNSSYIFEPGPENQEVETDNLNQEKKSDKLSDSDETDCEEIASVIQKQSVKQEPLPNVEFEDTQVLTLTLPDKYQAGDALMTEESPTFESGIENPRSPELIIETRNKLLEDESGVVEDYHIPSKLKKIEVGVSSSVSNSGKEVDSPLKRPLNSESPDVVPIKKSKSELLESNEKKLLKLVQAHDIALIQPSRTRNSIKTNESSPNKTDSSVTNEHTSSRRKANPKKINGDIKSYFTIKVETRRTSGRGRVKETSPIENSTRVLRSSRRISRNIVPINTPIRKSKRLSRTKNEYFTGSCVNVVFTGFSCDSLEKIITELGGKKADDLTFGEVVVADKVRRTVKFLCAIGLGLPITSPEWLMSCKREQKFINPWDFILQDEDSEEKYNFELRTSLERSRRVKLLEGFSIYATRSTKPPAKDLLAIAECCGGIPLPNPPDIWPKKTIIVSCTEDEQCWPLPKYRNIKIVHYEFILGGVLRQKIDFKTYQLR